LVFFAFSCVSVVFGHDFSHLVLLLKVITVGVVVICLEERERVGVEIKKKRE